MSGTRFARTGRCRFLVCFGILVLMVGMVAIFHSSQIQLDETREQRLHCEQHQEALNKRFTSLVELKFHLEKNQERERTEYLETKRNLEQKIKDLEEKHEKEQVESQMRYDKLQQAHKLLQSDHKHLKEENTKANKQHLENINGLENKLQSLKSELKKEKSNKSGEMYMYKEKYNTAEQEKLHITNTLSRMEKQLKEYKSHCDYKPQEISRKPVAPKPDIAGDAYTSTSEKSFNHQEPVSDGVYQIAVNISNSVNKETMNLNYTNGGDGAGSGGGTGGGRHNGPSSIAVDHTDDNKKQRTTRQDTQIPNTNPVFKPLITKQYNGSLILNSVENFQIVPPKSIKSPGEQQPAANSMQQNQVAPLSAPKNQPSTASAKSEQQMPSASALNAASANTRNVLGNGSSSTSNTPPLPLPSNQRKQLPENVAPIPEGFEDILQKSNNNEQSKNADSEANKNVVNALKASALKSANNNNNNNYDFGAQDVKDNENMNDDQNLAHDEDIFDSDNDADKVHHKQKGMDDTGNNDDDDGGGLLGADNENDGDGGGAAAGDIAVKHNQQQMIEESLKNEIANDQGKEFGDGLRLEEGAMEEDDDDDYSNPSARKKADKAVRH